MKRNIFLMLSIFVLISGCVSQSSETIQETGMTFEVMVPNNTMEGDTVYVYVNSEKFRMNKIAQFKYSITLTDDQLQLDEDTSLNYRYSRNGYDFHTAEYLEPDTNDYFWTQKGRTTEFENGKVQKDIVKRWRFFPEEGMITKTTLLEPQGKFLPRINNTQFRSGQTIEDLYVEAYYEFFNSTAKHLKKQGFNWVELDPPWQWIEVDGFPKVSNEFGDNPNYPDDKTFLDEARAYKQEGIKVLIAPQLCCTELNKTNKSDEWWYTYFNETEKFLVHFATLAEQGDADAFSYTIVSDWDQNNIPVDVEKEWRRIFGSIREVFDGKVGQMIGILGPEVSPSPSPIPDIEYIKWVDMLDFIMVGTEFPLSEKDNPTDEELEEKAGQVVDGVKKFYDQLGIPIIIRNGYFNVKYSWKGQAFYQINSVPWISDPEAKLEESVYEFNTEDHARVVHAYFKAIRDRPWIVGYFHFGYTHWEDPLSPWMSIRGKPAEHIWMKWNDAISD